MTNTLPVAERPGDIGDAPARHQHHDTDADADVVREMPTRLDVPMLREWIERPDRPRVIDVRSAAEFDAAHIPGAYNVPLPLLKEHGDELAGRLNEQLVLVCRTDNRSGQAERLLQDKGLDHLHVLSGGMTAWQQAQAPVGRGRQRWDLERQVRLVAGGVVLAGIVGSTVVPKAKYLSAFVGGGLLFAALSDTCAMGSLLSKLPLQP